MDIQLKTYKKDFEHTYSFGVFPTLELLNNKCDEVIKVIIASNTEENEGVTKIKEICTEHDIEVIISDKTINRVSPKENCYAVGVLKKYTQTLETNKNHVVLVNPSDMGNMGTIIRTMLGFGISNLAIVKPGVDIFDPKVLRASMGSVFKLKFQYFNDFKEYKQSFNNEIYPFMLNAKKSLHDIDMPNEKPFSLIFGNEGSGLPDDFINEGTSVIIPHSHAIDSLNLSIAVGIAIYEFTKSSNKYI